MRTVNTRGIKITKAAYELASIRSAAKADGAGEPEPMNSNTLLFTDDKGINYPNLENALQNTGAAFASFVGPGWRLNSAGNWKEGDPDKILSIDDCPL